MFSREISCIKKFKLFFLLKIKKYFELQVDIGYTQNSNNKIIIKVINIEVVIALESEIQMCVQNIYLIRRFIYKHFFWI